MRAIIYKCDICKRQQAIQFIYGYRFDTSLKPNKGVIDREVIEDNHISHICECCVNMIYNFKIENNI